MRIQPVVLVSVITTAVVAAVLAYYDRWSAALWWLVVSALIYGIVALNGVIGLGQKLKAMPSQKFNVGDAVTFKRGISRNAPGGVFEVVKVLPGNGEREYRIKSANEEHQRLARESELTLA